MRELGFRVWVDDKGVFADDLVVIGNIHQKELIGG